MAIYHCSVGTIGRSSGKSSVAAAAYRAEEKIINNHDGITHDYSNKNQVEFKEILTPDNTPKWAKNRAELWNKVEAIEKRKDSQLAREFTIALPKELNKEQRINLIRDYAKSNFIDKGMIADVCLHNKQDGNPHAHIMLTMRPIINNEFGKKNRDWNNKELLIKWRENWSIKANQHLKKAGINEQIDHRSYEERGIEKIPTKHEGVSVRAMEKKGIKTEIGDLNREIKKQNETLIKINQLINDIQKRIKDEFRRVNEKIRGDGNGIARGGSETIRDDGIITSSKAKQGAERDNKILHHSSAGQRDRQKIELNSGAGRNTEKIGSNPGKDVFNLEEAKRKSRELQRGDKRHLAKSESENIRESRERQEESQGRNKDRAESSNKKNRTKNRGISPSF